MIASNEQEELMVRYLLGEVTEDEAAQVEKRFLADHDYFEQLLALEEAIVDQYATGNLPDAMRDSFETSSVSQRRENLEFTRELIEDIRQKEKVASRIGTHSVFAAIFTRRYLVPASLAAATLLVLAVAPWILVLSLEKRLTQTQSELKAEQHQAEEDLDAERRTHLDTRRQLDDLQASGLSPGTELLLSAPLKPYRGQRAGGGETKLIEVTAQLQVVILSLSLEKLGSYESYVVKIAPADGAGQMRISGLTLENDRSILRVPVMAAKLDSGDYDLTVLGVEDNRDPVIIENYSFRVKRAR